MAHSRIGAGAEPFLVAPELSQDSLSLRWVPREERMGLLRQMLETLEDATAGGHRYLMAKMLVLFHREALDPEGRFTSQQRDLVDHSLDALEHEIKRIYPEAIAFQRAGQILVELFAIA